MKAFCPKKNLFNNFFGVIMVTKTEIFDLFYEPQDTVRSGGGKVKTKMASRSVTTAEQQNILQKIRTDQVLTDYYNKLRHRDKKLAPPPRPVS